jgi:tetratricopeptide (TPR) repeat protein
MLVDINQLYQKAGDTLRKEKPSQQELGDAFDILTALLNMQPKNPLLLYSMGTIAAKKSQNALAIMLLEVCLQIAEDSEIVSLCLLNLGLCHRKEERHAQARQCYDTALEILSKPPGGREKEFDEITCFVKDNMSGLHVARGTPDEGLAIIEEIEKRWPDYADMKRTISNKALMLLEKGRYGEGFDMLDNHSSRPVTKSYYGDPVLWGGTKGATVLVVGEQGIGDEIMFASMIPDLMKDCNVVMDSHMRLADMFRRSFGCPVYGTREFSTLMWRPPEMPYYKIPIGSLGRFYRRNKEDFPGTPYLKTDPALSKRLKEKLDALGGKPKIGISWRGGTKATNKAARQIPLEAFLPIFKTVDAEWISLQYHEMSQKEVDHMKEKYGVTIHHWQDVMDDYDMTAALVENLDLVVSVPQSVVHLAGALGKETIQLSPKQAMWQVGVYGEDAPWYKCVKNIWQPDFNDWESVLKQLEAQLCSLYPTPIAA